MLTRVLTNTAIRLAIVEIINLQLNKVSRPTKLGQFTFKLTIIQIYRITNKAILCSSDHVQLLYFYFPTLKFIKVA